MEDARETLGATGGWGSVDVCVVEWIIGFSRGRLGQEQEAKGVLASTYEAPRHLWGGAKAGSLEHK